MFGIREATLTFAQPEDAWDFTYSDGPTNTLVSAARLKEGLITYDGTGAAPVIAAGGTLAPADPTTAPLVSEQAFQLALAVNPSPTNPNSPLATGSNPAPAGFTVMMDLSQVTQFGSKFAIADLTQDGYASGELTDVSISEEGLVMASYSNGMTRTEAQVALANFRNPQGLIEVGGNNWIESASSGSVLLGKPGSGQFGLLRSGTLEDSNVDLTAELVNMITAQRAYQANAQTIKTQDQVMSTIVNLR